MALKLALVALAAALAPAAAAAASAADGPQTYYVQNMSGVDDMARCLDGSPYIFYVAPGDENVMIWVSVWKRGPARANHTLTVNCNPTLTSVIRTSQV